jgi:hypothetical protein
MEQLRRIVTTENANGQSIFMSDDAPSASVSLSQDVPSYKVTEVWRAALNDGADWRQGDDPTAGGFVATPPERGASWRIFERPPDSVVGFPAESTDPDAERQGWHSRGEGWQKGNDLNLVTVITGEIWILLDTSEVFLTAGDCLVQRGNMHRLSNRSSETCLMSIVVMSHV